MTTTDRRSCREQFDAIFMSDPSLVAVEVTFADGLVRVGRIDRQPSDLSEGTRQRLDDLLTHELADCLADPAAGACSRCILQNDAGPSGTRVAPGHVGLRAIEGGLLIERRVCPAPIAPPRRWSEFRVQPRSLPAHPLDHDAHSDWRLMAFTAAICLAGTIIGYVLSKALGPQSLASWAAYVVAIVAGAWFPAQEAWKKIRERTLDIDFLMLLVAFGAMAIGAPLEGAILLFLFSGSHALEEFALHRTNREIRSLINDAPRTATRLVDGREEPVPLDALRPGHLLLVRPGEQFPVDAILRHGETEADESMLTGEARPVPKRPGDEALGGTANLWGAVQVEVLRYAAQSTRERIIRLIREAQEHKAPAQRFTDRFGTQYTLAVLAFVSLMTCVWGAWGAATQRPDWLTAALYQGMTLLVVASPCALVLSIPSAILAAIASGARQGILFRGGAAVERLAEVHRIALDKTGTITTGHLRVATVLTDDPAHSPDDLLRRIAAVEHLSEHPLARAIVHEARRRGMALPPVTDFRATPGQGAEGTVEGQCVRIGRAAFCGLKAADAPLQHPGTTRVYVRAGDVTGSMLLEDDLRPEAAPLLAALTHRGIECSILTGDNEASARRMAEHLPAISLHHSLHPEDKATLIRQWQEAGQRVAMVGDGVNDAPSLALAHVGIAMGGRGSDAALEQADVVLMNDRLENVITAMDLSTRARRIIRQNLAVSLGTIILLVIFTLAGAIPLYVGVIGHEGSTALVTLNSMRLLRHRKTQPV